MTLRKTTVDNSVNYIPQSEQTQSFPRDIKPNTKKKVSLPRKQNKKLSQNIKKFVKDIITGEGFRILKRKMNCYF